MVVITLLMELKKYKKIKIHNEVSLALLKIK